MHAIAHGVVWGPSIFSDLLFGLFRAVTIGSGETAVFVVVDDRMVTFGTSFMGRRCRAGSDRFGEVSPARTRTRSPIRSVPRWPR